VFPRSSSIASTGAAASIETVSPSSRTGSPSQERSAAGKASDDGCVTLDPFRHDSCVRNARCRKFSGARPCFHGRHDWIRYRGCHGGLRFRITHGADLFCGGCPSWRMDDAKDAAGVGIGFGRGFISAAKMSAGQHPPRSRPKQPASAFSWAAKQLTSSSCRWTRAGARSCYQIDSPSARMRPPHGAPVRALMKIRTLRSFSTAGPRGLRRLRSRRRDAQERSVRQQSSLRQRHHQQRDRR